MKFFLAVLALAAGASAIIPGQTWSAAEVAAARAAHLGEVSRISGERLAALNAALQRAGSGPVAAPVAAQAIGAIGGGRIWSAAEVDAARAAHLGEVARQNGAALAALNAALVRAGQAVPQSIITGQLPQAIPDNADVAAARAAHLAEVARQNGAALNALAAANAKLDVQGKW